MYVGRVQEPKIDRKPDERPVEIPRPAGGRTPAVNGILGAADRITLSPAGAERLAAAQKFRDALAALDGAPARGLEETARRLAAGDYDRPEVYGATAARLIAAGFLRGR